MAKLYPDISHHHPVMDWNTIEKNCPFLITKATEGQTYVDPTLNEFIKQCEKRNIPYWLYTFLRKGDELAQVKFMVKTCKNKIGKNFIGYILDVESKNNASSVKEALKYTNSLGYKTMLYTMYADYDKYENVIKNRGSNCAFWEARYGLNNGEYNKKFKCHANADLHQYTSLGKCSGITGSIDLNRITYNGAKTLAWFTTPKKTTNTSSKKTYSGTFPALPSRGYYKVGDGYKTLTDCLIQIKRVQKLMNWLLDMTLTVDGKYGAETAAAVKKFQKAYSLTADGLFGSRTLAKAKSVKKQK